MRTVRGQSKIVLKPKSTEEVAALMGHCVSRKLAICPQGGNTGLVGGSVPVFDEVIVSTSLMDKIEGRSVSKIRCKLTSLTYQGINQIFRVLFSNVWLLLWQNKYNILQIVAFSNKFWWFAVLYTLASVVFVAIVKLAPEWRGVLFRVLKLCS